jgi:radical SAM protein with 4Fe4S-binding SPASM domain
VILAASDYVVRRRHGLTRIRPATGKVWPMLADDGLITITLTAGFAETDPDFLIARAAILVKAASEFQNKFGQDKSATLPRYCRECEVRHLCHGECPKHRFIRTPDGDPGLNYLCRAYKKFFNHSAPAMQRMAELLRAGRAPAAIMGEVRLAGRGPR